MGDYERHTLIVSLKACAKRKDLRTGRALHAEMVRMGLFEKDIYAGSTLISMYAKCGSLGKAQEVLDNLPLRNAVSWSALIGGYAQQGRGQEALNCYEQMQLDGIFPDAVTFACILKACGSIGAIDKGRAIHAALARGDELDKDVFVGTALVDMYAKCGFLDKAQEAFDMLSVRNVVSWNVLISGYAQQGKGEKALSCFDRMQLEGVPPDSVAFLGALKACGSIQAANRGQLMHGEIVRGGFLKENSVVGTALVDMYAKCGFLVKAQEVFDSLSDQDVVAWSALITGYAQHGHCGKALSCFEQMRLAGILPDPVVFVCILKACGNLGAADKGQKIHDEIAKEEFLRKNLSIGIALVDMYGKCNMLVKAQQVFDKFTVRNLVFWNVLISGYAQHGHGQEALDCFEWMQLEGFSPDMVTFVCILKACGSIGCIAKGVETHMAIVKEGLLAKDNVIGNALVDMYVKCGLLDKAQEVFDNLSVQDVVSWNALITGYAQHDRGEEALNCFERMQLDGITPSSITFVCILKACGSIKDADRGEEIHREIIREGLKDEHVAIGTALVDMYAKCGVLAKAQEAFDDLPVRDAVTWSVLIAGYAQNEYYEDALSCFDRMQDEGMSPDEGTFTCVVKACGNVGAADKGMELHAEIVREGLLQKQITMGNALVDMYIKCGLLAKAQEMFDNLPVQDLVSWNALITGYALFGKAEDAFSALDKMIRENVKPDMVTFVSLFNVCSHTGFLEEACMFFETMSTTYDIIPTLEHYSCMVDLFGRAGLLDKAVRVIKEMPYFVNLTMWHAVLGACRKWCNVELGTLAFEHAVQLDEESAGAYVCMRNIYLDVGRLVDADKVEAVRVGKIKHRS